MKKVFLLFLISMFSLSFVHAQENANVVLESALKSAKKENKNVLLFFHASWCGWCKLMEKNMQLPETKDYFSNNFVMASIDVQERGEKKKLENPEGEALMEKYGGKDAGLPFWLILNADGEVVTDSFNEKGENLGSPATPEEVESFIEKLLKTTKINEKEIEMIKQVFTKKN